MGSINLEGLEQVQVDAPNGAVTATFARSLYPLDAVYGAAYIFIDRCYVFLDAPDAEHVRVQLRARPDTSEEALESMAGEFANELLSQAWRREIADHNKPIIEAVVSQALQGALGGSGGGDFDDFDDMDFSDETFEDPLGIAMSWEEKYGKGGKPEEGEPASPPGPADGGDEPEE